MIWTPIALAVAALSSISAALITFKLYRDWDFRVSSVRWLFLTFFAYLWLYTACRTTYYLWVVTLPANEFVDSVNNKPLSLDQLDALGVYATTDLEATRRAFPTAILCICDVMHFSAAFWVLPLTYELSKIAAKSMDRGPTKEQQCIRVYMLYGHLLVAVFLITEITITVAQGGYSTSTYRLVLAVYIMQIITIAYMLVLLVLLKRRGRNVESINGHFEVSPVYQRLKRIMLVYAVLAFQHEVTSLCMYTMSDTRNGTMLGFVGASQVVYNSTGFALALCTGCSLPCVLRAARCCIPDDLEAQLLTAADKYWLNTPPPGGSEIAPLLNPVFVVTDIESSSALWAKDDGLVMDIAVQIHDDILRSLLASYRGYEITTAGDSFQLAFHTIREAVAYCIDVQMQLLTAKWPKELHGLVPATRKLRIGPRLLFRGLRVRMGVHDANPLDGPLVHCPHAVTGRMTYTGASVEIANEIGDLGEGGQILVTQRVADWLQTNAWLMDDSPFQLEPVGDYDIPQVDAALQLFQVLPEHLSKRRKVFADMEAANDLVPDVADATVCLANSKYDSLVAVDHSYFPFALTK